MSRRCMWGYEDQQFVVMRSSPSAAQTTEDTEYVAGGLYHEKLWLLYARFLFMTSRQRASGSTGRVHGQEVAPGTGLRVAGTGESEIPAPLRVDR